MHKPITKAEKDAANNKRSSPIKAANAKNASQINFIDNKLIHDGTMPGRVLHIRHHLGRTTGLGMDNCFLGIHVLQNRFILDCFVMLANSI